MAQIGTVRLETQNSGVVDVPVFEPGDSASGIYEYVRVETASGPGFIPVTAPADATYPYLRVQSANDGIVAVTDTAGSDIPDSVVYHHNINDIDVSLGSTVDTWTDREGNSDVSLSDFTLTDSTFGSEAGLVHGGSGSFVLGALPDIDFSTGFAFAFGFRTTNNQRFIAKDGTRRIGFNTDSLGIGANAGPLTLHIIDSSTNQTSVETTTTISDGTARVILVNCPTDLSNVEFYIDSATNSESNVVNDDGSSLGDLNDLSDDFATSVYGDAEFSHQLWFDGTLDTVDERQSVFDLYEWL